MDLGGGLTAMPRSLCICSCPSDSEEHHAGCPCTCSECVEEQTDDDHDDHFLPENPPAPSNTLRAPASTHILVGLPEDCTSRIFAHTSPACIGAMARSCSTWTLAARCPRLWAVLFRNHFPGHEPVGFLRGIRVRPLSTPRRCASLPVITASVVCTVSTLH